MKAIPVDICFVAMVLSALMRVEMSNQVSFSFFFFVFTFTKPWLTPGRASG